MIYMYVGLGGIAGSLLRYVLSILAIQLWGPEFPVGTLLINVTGSFLLGWMSSKYILPKKGHPYLLTALSTGVIGSYTTFSTFCLETIKLLKTNHYLIAFLYITLSLIGGLLFVRLGFGLGERGTKEARKIS
ncbi:fluoride efflux transporter CrcB [Neobacillus pocheonensis]|uniref:fluoride efflux transporter CrcB n=1 Tax=Neobacillus pocheonensis TaxID=363869 RepID=UPI003D26D4B8